MTRRHWAVPGLVGVAAAVMVAVAASACSSTPAKTGPHGHVTLQLWTFPGSEDVLPPVIKAFNKKYSPAITVQVTNVPESSYGTKLDLAISANSGPDLAFPTNALDLPGGRFLPLDSEFKRLVSTSPRSTKGRSTTNASGTA